MNQRSSPAHDDTVPRPPALTAEGVTKGFGGLTAVDDVSLEAAAGKVTALIGPNGAGKTTLFNVLTHFEAADAGRIQLFGDDISGQSPADLAHLGMVRSFQTPVGFPSLSVLENLVVAGSSGRTESLFSALRGRSRWGAAEDEVRTRAEEMLAHLGLEEHRHALVDDLPGGDIKLVDFGRLLMMNPRLLLLDEPAAGVDPTAIDRLAARLRELRERQMSVLIIDHNVSFVMDIADTVYVLDQGRLVAHGDPVAIAADPAVQRIYLGSE